MDKQRGAATAPQYFFRYRTCRNISAPEDDRAGRRVYTGHAPASSFLALEDNENVREYIVGAPGKAKRVPTLVHQAIRNTLEEHPDDFSVLNGGMVLVAQSADVDDKSKIVLLTEPSIINGSQTQGELRRYFEDRKNPDGFFEPSVKFEIIVTDDVGLIGEISIARNFQNDVSTISIAGRRGQLNDLEAAIKKSMPDAKLRKSETDIVSENGFLDTEKLIQVAVALMPPELIEKLDVGDSKVFTYSQKTRCLRLFQRVYEDPALKAIYRYFLDIAPVAWKIYGRWKSHQGFRGTGLRAIKRDAAEIVEVPDGILFPILASFSAFVTETSGTWQLRIPKELDERELIDVAKQAYMEIAEHNPQTMGKKQACYSALLQVTKIYARLIASNKA